MEELFSALHQTLKSSITNHYNLLLNKFPDLYGYCVYTDNVLRGVTAIAGYESLWDDNPDHRYDSNYRYSAVEWLNAGADDGFEHFVEPNEIIDQIRKSRLDYPEYDKSVSPLIKKVLEIWLEVLVELEAEGVFGERSDNRFIAIFLSDSDKEIKARSIKALNSSKVAAEAIEGMGF